MSPETEALLQEVLREQLDELRYRRRQREQEAESLRRWSTPTVHNTPQHPSLRPPVPYQPTERRITDKDIQAWLDEDQP